MFAQAYHDKNLMVRIFPDRNAFAVADLPLEDATDEEADKSLAAIGLRRVGRWRRIDDGREAKVVFDAR